MSTFFICAFLNMSLCLSQHEFSPSSHVFTAFCDLRFVLRASAFCGKKGFAAVCREHQ